jgi:hypothetical protein
MFSWDPAMTVYRCYKLLGKIENIIEHDMIKLIFPPRVSHNLTSSNASTMQSEKQQEKKLVSHGLID